MAKVRFRMVDACPVFFLVAGLCSNYIEFFTAWKIALLALLLCMLQSSGKYQGMVMPHSLVVELFALLGLLTLSAAAGADFETYFKNLYTIAPTVAILLIFSLVYQKDDNLLFRFFSRHFLLINLVWFFNLLTLTLQVSGIHFMIKDKWLAINPFYEDACSGIFGASGTHTLSIFAAFILIYNLTMIHMNIVSRRRMTLLFTIGSELYMLYLCTLSDNNAFIFLVLLFSAIWWLGTRRRGTHIKVKAIFAVALLVATLIVAYNRIPGLRLFVETTTLRRLDNILNTTSKQSGSSERIAIALYAFEHRFGWKLGYGFGSWPFDAEGLAGFRHFGINSFSTLVFLCGIWIYIAYVIIYSRMIIGFSGRKTHFQGWAIVSVIVMTFFTSIFWDMTQTIWLGLTLYFIRKARWKEGAYLDQGAQVGN